MQTLSSALPGGSNRCTAGRVGSCRRGAARALDRGAMAVVLDKQALGNLVTGLALLCICLLASSVREGAGGRAASQLMARAPPACGSPVPPAPRSGRWRQPPIAGSAGAAAPYAARQLAPSGAAARYCRCHRGSIEAVAPDAGNQHAARPVSPVQPATPVLDDDRRPRAEPSRSCVHPPVICHYPLLPCCRRRLAGPPLLGHQV